MFLEDNGVATTTSNAVVQPNLMRDMVMDAYGHASPALLHELPHNEEHEPIPEARRFIELLKAAERPLYEGCEMSLLKAVAQLTNLKCEYNLPHRAVDGIASFHEGDMPKLL